MEMVKLQIFDGTVKMIQILVLDIGQQETENLRMLVRKKTDGRKLRLLAIIQLGFPSRFDRFFIKFRLFCCGDLMPNCIFFKVVQFAPWNYP